MPLSDRQPMYQDEGQSGTVVAVFVLENDEQGQLQLVGKSPEQIQSPVEKALMEFRRLTNGDFTPEARCAVDRAFVEVVNNLLNVTPSQADSFCGSLTGEFAEAVAGDHRGLRTQNAAELSACICGGARQPCPYSGDKKGHKDGRPYHRTERHG